MKFVMLISTSFCFSTFAQTMSETSQVLNVEMSSSQEHRIDDVILGIHLGSFMSDDEIIQSIKQQSKSEVVVMTDDSKKAFKAKEVNHEGYDWKSALVQVNAKSTCFRKTQSAAQIRA